MSNFDINRFGRTLRWVVSVNFRKMLLWFTGSVLAVFLGEVLSQMMYRYDTPLDMTDDVSLFLRMILIIVSLIMVSSIVSNINEKRKREAFLMLPSSNLEKYLSLVIYSTVICIACAFLAIVLGDALRMLAYWASGYQGQLLADGTYKTCVIDDETGEAFYWWSSSIPMMIEGMFTITNYSKVPVDFIIVEMAFVVGSILWTHSIYTLGGTLLRKYSFVATSVFVILCLALLVKLIVLSGGTMFSTQWDHGKLVRYEIGTMSWICAIAFPILSVLNYWASYRIFKGFELITNKWFNYDFYKR